MKVIVAQKGAREHYLIARSLYERKMLSQLIVDRYPKRMGIILSVFEKLGFQIAQRALDRRCPFLPDNKVKGLSSIGIAEYLISAWHSRRGEIPYKAHYINDRNFSLTVANMPLPDHEIFMAYSYAALEALKKEKELGKLTVLCQIDPGIAERKIVEMERKRWPDYFLGDDVIPKEYEERVKEEWRIADVIMVNSPWSRDALISEGVPAQKIEILPLAYEPSPFTPKEEMRSEDNPLRVLWLGDVIPRKGIQYLVEAAKILTGENVEFIVVGKIRIPAAIVQNAPGNIKWKGLISRSQTIQFYQKSDLFVLPTLSDGFAITQLEAMSYGLPVVATNNCGRVVQDGLNGYIIPSHDSLVLAESIFKCMKNRDLLVAMSKNSQERAKQFGISQYGEKLITILRTHYEQK